jgi:phosphate transport system permease protein
VIPTGNPEKADEANSATAVVSGLDGIGRPARFRFPTDKLFYSGTMAAGLSVLLLILWIGFELFIASAPTRHQIGWGILTGVKWDANREIFGALPFIYGSLVSAFIAIVVSVPLAVGCAVFLTQYARPWLAKPIAFLLDLLAAVPSIVFGLWGIFVMCPFLQAHVNPWLVDHFGKVPFFQGPSDLQNLLAAGLILALMILPFITAVAREVLLAIPPGYGEASMALGSTKWETIRSAILPASTSGIMGATVLGLGRAVGETMAAVMVIGSSTHIKASILQAGYSMPALLANKFGEAANEEMPRSALLEIALILFAMTFVLNALARLLIRLTSKTGSKSESTPWVQVLKMILGTAGKFSVYVAVGGFVLIQLVSDLKAKGASGLFGPIEIVAAGYLGIRFVSNFLSDTVHWGKFRKANDFTMRSMASLTAFLACACLFMILGYVILNGAPGLNVNLFTQLPKSGPGGGLKHAILGTITLVSLASLFGIPIGVFGGVFLSEFPESKFSFPIRFASDVLSGIPSIVIGLFAYAAFVLPFGHFSAYAGGAALGVMMIPTIIRITDEMMRLVPNGVREASVGLGATRMQTTMRVILPAARKGVITGIVLAIARVSGETAPLLFTALGSNHIPKSLSEQISSLTLVIYTYSGSASPDWVQQAWSGALVLVLLILVLSLVARFATRSKYT